MEFKYNDDEMKEDFRFLIDNLDDIKSQITSAYDSNNADFIICAMKSCANSITLINKLLNQLLTCNNI